MDILMKALDAIGSPKGLRADSRGSLRAVLGNAEYAELASRGEIFTANTLAGTAKAPVVAPPTTSPEWVLWNGHPTKTMIPLRASAVLISGTSGVGLSLMGGVTTQEQLEATMAAYAGVVIGRTDGGGNDSQARIANNPTIVGTPAYDVLAAKDMLAQDAVGLGLTAELKGAYAVPPKFGFALEVVGETGTTALYAVSFTFALIELARAGQ